jgi:hypothetical protein
MEKIVYLCIWDFIKIAKGLFFAIKLRYNYTGESVFYGIVEKKIPRKGEIEFNGLSLTFWQHGNHVEFFKGEELLICIGFFHKGLGINFNVTDLLSKKR